METKPIQWQEPVSFRNAINSLYFPTKPDLKPAILIGIGIAVVGWVAQYMRDPQGALKLQSVATAIGMGSIIVVTALFLGLVNYYSARLLVVNPQGVFIKEFQGAAIIFRTWKWEYFTHFTVEQMELKGRRYLALIGHLKDGNRLYFGLNWLDKPRKVPVDSIVNFVQSHGVPLERLA